MWLVVIALFGYHAWCWHSGRIRFTVGDGVTRRTRWISKEEAPLLFWGVWLGGAAFTVLFAVASLLYAT